MRNVPLKFLTCTVLYVHYTHLVYMAGWNYYCSFWQALLISRISGHYETLYVLQLNFILIEHPHHVMILLVATGQ